MSQPARPNRREFLIENSLAILTGAAIPLALARQQASAGCAINHAPTEISNPYHRFTDRARSVLRMAAEECLRLNHEYIGTKHILLGLVKEGSGVAVNVLINLNVELSRIRLEVEKVDFAKPDVPADNARPQTTRFKKIIDNAIDEARRLNHNYVGTEHLLIGLLREQESVGGTVLSNLGVGVVEAREEVICLLGYGNDSASSP